MSDEGESPSQVWRVQVLPLGKISYRDRELDFTREYLAGLIRAFDERAFEVVPFVLAGENGEHTSDPARWRGEVRGLEMAPDGLDAVVAVTEDGGEALRRDPGLGAAPRIIESYRCADGRTFPAAIQHVLGTRHPVITGLRPWQPVFFGEVTWEQMPGALIAFKGDAVFLAPDPAAGEEESAGDWDESGWTEIGFTEG